MEKKRPTGVTWIARFEIALGVLLLFICVTTLPSWKDPDYHTALALSFSFGAIALFLGLGMLRLRSWARRGMVFFSWIFFIGYGLNLGYGLILLFTSPASLLSGSESLIFLPVWAYSLFCVVYLTRPVVRESFRSAGTEPSLFFSQEERQRIVSAIREAETKTSAEIRVYLERKAKVDLMEQARKVFEKLGMTRTEKRNGVLIYFSLVDHRFAVLGDRGIHEKVGNDFWKDVVSLMQGHFSRGEFVEGLEAGIARVGEKLKVYFPWERGDINELPDEVQG